MAKVFRAPEGFEAPAIDWRGDWQKQEQEYLTRLADRCKMNGTNPLHGEVIRFQRADGYALYMVWSTKPLALIHIELGDAYSVEDALLRGLRLSDVREQVEREQRIRDLFARKAEDKR
jgi:hypothetical protein